MSNGSITIEEKAMLQEAMPLDWTPDGDLLVASNPVRCDLSVQTGWGDARGFVLRIGVHGPTESLHVPLYAVFTVTGGSMASVAAQLRVLAGAQQALGMVKL